MGLLKETISKIRKTLYRLSVRYYNKLHNRLTLRVSEVMQPYCHSNAGYDGPWIENYFFIYWTQKNKEILKDNKIDRIYIPIFWTDYYLRYHYWKGDVFKDIQVDGGDEIQKVIDENVKPDKKYFTIVQHDNGIGHRLPKNILVFSAGGKGNVPIPFIKGKIEVRSRKRDIICSFMGGLKGAHNRGGIRETMFDSLKEENYYFGEGTIEEFVHITSRSIFSLCPRGFGRTSFRLYEVMALGSIPIYIWDDVKWLPYEDVLSWDEFSITINIKDIAKLPAIIDAHTPEMIEAKRRKLKQLYDEYFTLEGTCNQIIRMLKEHM